MKAAGVSFHHPVAFWIGIVAIAAGVLAHAPMFVHSAHDHYRMAGMPMDDAMMWGMLLIPVGLLLSAYGLMPRLAALRRPQQHGAPLHFHVADFAPLNRAHWGLVAVLVVAMIVDVMKPATLGFVIPGMTREYEIRSETAGVLALVALTGTTVGSLLWGWLADSLGRRAAILLSALMFMSTAICGAMPVFEWNLAMCFLMGAAAGGLLPITFTLMSETIPAAHRGWLLVALGGVGTAAGYLVAAGAAAWLEPIFSWRSLWLLGLPTGLLIVILNHWIPESPRFLAAEGLQDEAHRVLARFSSSMAPSADLPDAAGDLAAPRGGWRALRQSHSAITLGLVVAGVSWGLVNFGFMLWLPLNLGRMGMDPAAASALLARSALIALPGILPVIYLYHRWSTIKALVFFVALAAATLLGFCALGLAGLKSAATISALTALLLVASSGVIATLIPYASEIYPVHLRGTGAGLVAASSKAGGILGALVGVLGLLGHFEISALAICIPMIVSAVMLWTSGIETRGRRLEEIEASILARVRV